VFEETSMGYMPGSKCDYVCVCVCVCVCEYARVAVGTKYDKHTTQDQLAKASCLVVN